jgi:hypothetical protein
LNLFIFEKAFLKKHLYEVELYITLSSE